MNLKKLTGIVTLASVLGFASNANAAVVYDLYAGLTVGAGAATVFADHDNDTTGAQSFGAMFGLDIPVVRVEAEYNFLNDHDAKLHVGMANVYLKMPSVGIKPYLGVGVGGVFSGRHDDVDAKTAAAYQGMLGLTFDMPVLPLKIDGEARVLYAPDFVKVADVKPDLLHYELRIKLRYVF
ncbi:MAG: hypothetical protein LBF37_03900 [Rickettsiales bacterium]|jgi:opacity protein-like surface antigen|nr:hypothetical protein [Rickettsiales bacterium]